MLQRSEENASPVDCSDTDVVLACMEDLDKCPTACKAEYEEDNGEDEVVKSGSLEVTATANSSKSIVKAGTSDMDTLKFKTSEEVTLTKLVLERYGRSYWNSVDNVWLEDEDGNVITTSTTNTVNNKDRVTLSIKKDYRTVDGTLNAIVRVLTTNASGATIGFKVADVTSTAKDVDLGDYTPTEYDIVDYTAGTLTVSANATTKSYNYVAGDSYEVAKFKLRAGTSAIKVKGFTLKNEVTAPTVRLSDEDFLEDVVVTFDGKEVKNLNYEFDSDDNLVISFTDQEIEINKNATVVVSATLAEDFDEYGHAIQYNIKNSTDVKASEAKTSAQARVQGTPAVCPEYTFNGSKVKLTNNKLGNVDAAQGAEWVLIAEWNITLSEAINKGTITITPTPSTPAVLDHVDHLTLIINGDEYDSTVVAGNYTFSNVEIEESGKIQVKIDINENDNASGSISFGSLQFAGFKYVNDKNANVTPVGSITVSKVTLQPAKATMENNLTKSVQYLTEDWARKVVFEGTYTAKKWDVYLNKFAIVTTAPDALDTAEVASGYNYVRTFYVFVDGEEVGDTDDVSTTITASNITDATDSTNFDNVLVKKGESVSVKVEAEIDATNEGDYDYELFIWWVDENDNDPSWIAHDDMVTISLVNKGSVTIPTASSSKSTVLLKAKNSTLATFVVKPSNNNEGLTLENIVFTGTIATTPFSGDKIRVKVDGVEYDAEDDTTTMEYLINEDLPVDGLTVEVVLKQEVTGNVVLTVSNINDSTTFSKKTYTRSYADALVYITKQQNEWDFTKYTVGVDLFDDDYEVTNFALYTGDAASATACASTNPLRPVIATVEEGDTFEIDNGNTSVTIGCIQYTVNGTTYAFDRKTYEDYFKVDGSAWRVFSNNN